ncbi:LTA synthase family protein [Wielerella bovis]|uniref:LTA synthase family protein n=1 Tax=Wielerella bovis TaxID=2917790 RepID=UPI0020196676|nr:LTA synthase family protein [Wielerella bovis]MCG7657194.1 LTA synthase family protein [Wielerella bovis]MCG7659417.1 LTA synthase family protein [Wielerella bovis]
MKFTHIKKLLPEWACFFIASLVVLMAGRLFLFWRYTDSALREQYQSDIFPLFIKGLLFDIKAVCIALAVWVLLALLALFHRGMLQKVYHIQQVGLVACWWLLAAMTVFNVFYYATYHRQFDVFVFGLLEEDTVAVLKTIWSDYPVLRGGIGLLALWWVMWKAWTYLRQYIQKWQWTQFSGSLKSQIALILLMIVALTLGIRGSLGKFPLRQSSSQVSPSTTLNSLVVNAPIALSWAWREHRDSSHFHAVSDEDGVKLYQTMLNRSVNNANLNELAFRLPENPTLAENKPNVVLTVMESMGTHLLQMDTPQRDLLGRLRPHFEQDWLYTRFVSEGDGTSETLHRLFIRSPFNNISQTSARNKLFATNMFQPYLDTGYRVVYITAGNGGWRNFDQFLKHLGVHEFVDETFLRQRYPQASSSAWGVPDEYMFRYAAERLQQAQNDKQPVFIMMLSVTHHPPYQLPTGQNRQQFDFQDAELARFAKMGNTTQINEIFNTSRYTNDQLGAFISQAKQLGNTIVAATGDHNIRGIGYPKTEESALEHAVPFYLWLPENLRGNAVYQAERVGSHKDVMPTLYAVSLSGQSYLQTGCNLTALKLDDNPWCGYGYNQSVVIFPEGAMTLHDKRFYAWQQPEKLLLQAQNSTPPEHIAMMQSQQYGVFLDWLTKRMITQQP